ncbi:hypothetical protein USB125703_00751 [Pseudoclavibacter triregionum]|nr:hypothetical protein USB125703_00751 [Pseudoclavibacter triregionum]
MNLSRKNERKLKRLRKDAAKLWAEQRAVNARAAEVFGKAKSHAVELGQTELVPALKGTYEQQLRPRVEGGIAVARDVADDARIRMGSKLLPTLAAGAASVATLLANASKNDSINIKGVDLKATAKTAKQTSKELEKRAKLAMKEYDRKTGKSGLGAGGWVLVGTGAAALAALGYALWQTFRADDDLWIADEELDAPITTVKPSQAAAAGESTSDVTTHHLSQSEKDQAPSVGR